MSDFTSKSENAKCKCPGWCSLCGWGLQTHGFCKTAAHGLSVPCGCFVALQSSKLESASALLPHALLLTYFLESHPFPGPHQGANTDSRRHLPVTKALLSKWALPVQTQLGLGWGKGARSVMWQSWVTHSETDLGWGLVRGRDWLGGPGHATLGGSCIIQSRTQGVLQPQLSYLHEPGDPSCGPPTIIHFPIKK